METNIILEGDVLEQLKQLPDESVDCIVTSPPYYGLRDYGVSGQIGLESNLQVYLDKMIKITAELKRVLKREGTMFWNHGDNYSGKTAHSDWELSSVTQGKYAKSQQDGWGATGKRNMPKFKAKKDCGVIPDKSLVLQAYRLVIRMIDEQGWILRNQIIWHKPNAMPSSIKDRFGVDFEPVFFFVKSKKYYFKMLYEKSITGKYQDFNMRIRNVSRGYVKSGQYRASDSEVEQYHGSGIKTSMLRNKRSVWKIATQPCNEAHFATFPPHLIEPMIKAGCPIGGLVLDPFFGAGTSGLVALTQGKKFLGIEINPKYIEIAKKRLEPYMAQERLIKCMN